MKHFKRSTTLLTAASLLLLSSCNRGYGCPGTNFSVEELVSGLVALLF
ncbi:hypothetical protein [Lewinella sp. IMCC34191]|nr:hypothetical protein [Lewinella sp. IMCC34191]